MVGIISSGGRDFSFIPASSSQLPCAWELNSTMKTHFHGIRPQVRRRINWGNSSHDKVAELHRNLCLLLILTSANGVPHHSLWVSTPGFEIEPRDER